MVRPPGISSLIMHIPDGILSAKVAAGAGLVALAGVALACRAMRAPVERGKSALLGVSAAFVFAAQMVSFPVAAGASGHLVGGALAAALLGLPAAIVAMSAVLIVQCFVFGDGGLLALGANLGNMALVGCLVAHCVYRLGCGNRPSPRRRVACVAFAAWCATVAGAACCAEELALSGAAPLGVVLPAMLSVHALIGAGEAVITALIVSSLLRFRPELLEWGGKGAVATPANYGVLRYGFGLAAVLALLLAPISSTAPDGLSRVAARLGFDSGAGPAGPSTRSPLSTYAFPGLGSGALPTLLAGAIGIVFLFGLCWLLALVLAPRTRASGSAPRVASESSG